MAHAIDLTGQRFGRLTVLCLDSTDGQAYWRCRCDCGTERSFRSARLRSGYTTSCGCARTFNRKHGQTTGRKNTPEYRAYHAAKTRCTNPKQECYPDYGGRGIKFLFTSFEQWLAELGPRPTPQHTVDRIEVGGHYAPGNVRWATKSEQRLNSRNPKRGFGHTVLALFLLCTIGLRAQVVQLTGGHSSLYQGTGAGLTAYLPASTLYVGAGCAAGHCAFGLTDTFKFHGWDATAGDFAFGYSFDSAGVSTQVRGFNLQRTSPQQTTSFFVGSAALGSSTPFFFANRAQHIGAGFFHSRKSARWQLGTLEVVNGSKWTAVQGASYTGNKLRAGITGGLLENQRLFDVAARYQPIRNLQFSAGHGTTFAPVHITSDSASASAQSRYFTAQASFSRAIYLGRAVTGTGQGVGAAIGPATFQANWYQAAGQRVSFQTAQERITRRFSLQQVATQANRHASFGVGGAYHDNHISVSVEHGVAFTVRGWQQVTSVQISLRIPHTDAAVNVGTTTLATGQTKYTAYGSTWAKGPLQLQSAGPQRHTHSKAGRYLLQGNVVDRKGQPVTGAAVALGNNTVWTDSAGVFFIRLRRAQPVEVHVLPDQFTAPGAWVVVSAPDTAQPGQPCTIVVELN
jgi:hypothetical protein